MDRCWLLANHEPVAGSPRNYWGVDMINNKNDHISLIVIDPQKGFYHDQGSLSLKHGSDELLPIRATIQELTVALPHFPRRHLVQAVYQPAQFTQGNINDKLANLCVPSANIDCEIADALSGVSFSSVSIKHDQSALSSTNMRNVIDNDLREGVDTFVVAGFLLEHCIQKTAQDLKNYTRRHNVNIIVCRDLSASRVEKYDNGSIRLSYLELSSQGIELKSWQELIT